MVEADDHSAGNPQPIRLNGMNCLFEIEGVHVLHFESLRQTGLAGAFYADEHAGKIRIPHQFHELLVFCGIDAGLSVEIERMSALVVELDQLAQKLFGVWTIADKVVIREEYDFGARIGPELDFAQDFFDWLGAHFAAIHDDDVAELTGERAASRGL